MDLMQACRCCLRCPPDKDLTTPYTHLDKTEIYADMINQCFNIHLVVVGSGSCGICSACVGRLRDASDFKLQVQSIQAELQALLQGASVKEEPAVKLEMQDEDGASEDPLLNEEPPVKPETLDEDEIPREMLHEVLIKTEMEDKEETRDEMLVCLEGSARSVVLERLRGDATVINEDKPYSCDHCGKRFKTKVIVRKHIQRINLSTSNLRHHQRTRTVEKPFHRCDYCEYKTRKKAHLICHIRKHTGEKPYKCSNCDYRSSRKGDLRTHQRIHTADKPYTCNQCDFKCWLKSDLQKHEMKHGEKPLHRCTYCDYKARRKDHLQRHIRIHTGEKPYKCSHCDYKSTQQSCLMIHQMIHTREKTFQCSRCYFKSGQRSDLQKHKLIHANEKRFQCSYCDYKCKYNANLQIHLRIHTGEKPYTCSYCDYKFRRKETFLAHQQIHTGEKPYYTCSDCDYKCRDKSNLRRHRKKHGTKPQNVAIATTSKDPLVQ
ncbi:zinc finger protein 501-like isoform X2 [Cydia strobilella]|uniref:zinc finger protein 501-like isoform X2 n=1 Tax=Cydia strobilella TaxID=1100964 RepID=UPI00300523F8